MKHSLNSVSIIGNVGLDPVSSITSAGTPFSRMSVATNETWIGPSREKKEKTEWHRVVAWGKVAEICRLRIRKGDTVAIYGKLQTRKWDSRDGDKRYTTEVVAREVKLLKRKVNAIVEA